MSDNEDLLGDDLGDHSLADYNLGNDEEEQLLADDYENGPQNVPTSIDPNYTDTSDVSSSDFSGHVIPYSQEPLAYHPPAEECVVPNITVEVANTPAREHPTYAPYQPPVFDPELAVVPPAIPAAPIESPQIVPQELSAAVPNGESRERFLSERPAGAPQRTPQLRDIPDSLDKVLVPRGFPRGRTSWRAPHLHARHAAAHPYRRHHVQRGNFLQRASFPPPARAPAPAQPRASPPSPPRPDPPPTVAELPPERPLEPFRPLENRPPFQPFQRYPYEERPPFRPNFEPRFFRPQFQPRQFPPPVREVIPNSNHMPQITIRQALPVPVAVPKVEEFGAKREPEVRMLPVQLPANLPPGGLAGKKVLINPHFKGNFQPADGLPPVPTYIPTRIQKSPPLSPTLENKFGPIKDIDDAAERFIAEQRNALARAAGRKFPPRRSPQRYIENTTIEISNELAPPPGPWRADDDDLLRRQEEFIHANRAGLRRRMRSPTPPRRVSPRRSPERRRAEPRRPPSEETEYRRRLREQESLRERVLRAKELRRKKNAIALHKQLRDKERERDAPKDNVAEPKPEVPQPERPDTTRQSPEPPARDRSPVKDEPEVNSTCETLTPPRASPERALTPPLPGTDKREKEKEKERENRYSDDDELEFILGDIDDILSDDDDSGRFKDKASKPAPAATKPQADLRAKLPPRAAPAARAPRQKIVFSGDSQPTRGKEKTPPTKNPAVTSSTKIDTESSEKKPTKAKQTSDSSSKKSRQRIIFDNKELTKEKDDDKSKAFPNRRVVLQRKVTQAKEKSVFSRIETKSDPTKPNPGIFSRAVRTAIGAENSRIIVKKDEPEIEYESDSDLDEDKLLNEEIGLVANVTNLPHGITDTRLKTLAGNEVQSLSLDKEERTAKITFKTTVAADAFKKKFNNKMVAASRLTVTLR